MARMKRLWKVVLMAPLMGAFAVNGCAGKSVQIAANVLDSMATEMNGGDKNLGEWISDEIRGEENNQDFGEWLSDEVKDW